MTILELNKRYYTVPTNWNELSGKQLVRIMRVFYNQLTIFSAHVRLLKIICGISWWRMWQAGTLQIEDKTYLTDFLFADNNLTQNLLPSYRGYYGPSSDIGNLLVSEFIFADQYYRKYKDAESEDKIAIEALDYLIAILYRPVKKNYNTKLNPDGDARQPYNDNLTGNYAAIIHRWPKAVKMAILHWFEGCLFSLERDFKPLYTGKSDSIAKYGLWSVMRGVAEKGVHGNINQVEKMYLRVFFMELIEMKSEAASIQQKVKQKPTRNG